MDSLLQLFNEIGLPFAYHHFAEGESPQPPFLVYLFPNHNDYFADGINYHRVTSVNLELYTDKKDIEMENKIEEKLREYGISYEKNEVWIASEKLYEILYTFNMEVK